MRKVLGADHDLVDRFNAVSYSPSVMFAGMDTSGYQPAGVVRVVSLLNAAKDDLRYDEELGTTVAVPDAASDGLHSVFIVHGHDTALKEAVAGFLHDALGVKPTILHNMPNRGRVLQTKFAEVASGIEFAVILMTADDLGKAKAAEELQPRARQNVVFEHGFFAGLLGWDRVAVLFEPGVELPSDLDGLVYIEVDPKQAWRSELLRELKAAGASVDWESLGR